MTRDHEARLAAAVAAAGTAIATVVTEAGTWSSRGAAAAFRAASVTKTFVAAAFLALADRGELDLTAPFGQWLDPVLARQLEAAGFDPGALTAEQLLGHTSGLPDHSSAAPFAAAVVAAPARVWTRADQLAVALAQPRPDRLPHYSDTGYVLLGDVLERLTGRDLGAACAQLLDLPRHAPHTYWEDQLPPGPRFPQEVAGRSVWDLHPTVDLFGGGGLVTTTADLAGFGRALLGGHVLRAAALARMLAPAEAPGGLGLGIMRAPGPRPVWGHLGFWGTALLATAGGSVAVGVAVSPAPSSGGVDPGRLGLRLIEAAVQG